MKVIFGDEALQEIYETGSTKNSKYKILCRDKKFVSRYIMAIDTMKTLGSTKDLTVFSFFHYEKLKYQKNKIKSSIRIISNRVERLLFFESEDGIEIFLIELDNTHYGKKK